MNDTTPPPSSETPDGPQPDGGGPVGGQPDPSGAHGAPQGFPPPAGYPYAPQQPGYQQPGYQQPGPLPMLESEARNWAMLVHVIAAAALVLSAGTLAFLAPLVVWLIFRQRSALIDFHGKQNLNLQLTLIVVGFCAIVLGFITFGVGMLLTVPALFAYAIYAFVISIVAGLKAKDGEYYPIKFAIRFIR